MYSRNVNDKFPVSISYFSHFCIVDLETLKILRVASKLCPDCIYFE